jgi:peptide/nickel transport system ATP-binding protein
MTRNLLEIAGVTKLFPAGGLFSRKLTRALHDVSFTLADDRPEILAIVGESGSGKSTLANLILGSERADAGSVRFDGVDVAAIRTRGEREAFMAKVQPVLQNPFEAFNPLTPVDQYLLATARRYRGAADLRQAQSLADEALQRVGLSFAEVRRRFSHELSGGQLQRIAVARALIPSPRLIVADEPVSMVDASLRLSIVNLFMTLRDNLRVSIIYITHDLATAYYISDRVIILQKGQIVESGEARTVLDAPRHPYSIALKNAVLPPDPVRAAQAMLARQQKGSRMTRSDEQ